MRQGLDVALRAACVVHLVVLAGATAVAAFVGDRYWPVALFLLLPLPALLAPAALIAPALILARRWRWLLAQAVAVVLASVFLLGGAVSIPDRATGPTFRVLAWNVKFGGAGVHAFARGLRSVGPDVAIFEATSHEVHEALALAFPSFHIEPLPGLSNAGRLSLFRRKVPLGLRS